jgi:glycine dehydrogenase subunit 1
MKMEFKHSYLPNVPEIKKKMMEEIGVSDIEELFADIPQAVRLKKDIELPGPMSEYEVLLELKRIAAKNTSTNEMPTFLGGGVWNHYIPAHVPQLAMRSEFYTAYTPYQPEISQGSLQALFEYQSLICELTGMDAANASMYDWGSGLGEAALTAMRATKRNEFIVPRSISPERRSALEMFTRGVIAKITEVGFDKETGMLLLDELEAKTSEETAGIYIENPNYLGVLESQVKEIKEIAEKNDALFVVGVNPMSLGILQAPGDYGADIVIGEGQPLGLPTNFGGPLLGIFAIKYDKKFVRTMPGRLVGMTTTVDGTTRGYCLTLSAREQHIRREKACSNICSNEALAAIFAAIYLSTLGPKGLKKLGELCMANAQYLQKKINALDGFRAPLFDAVHFNEFTLQSTLTSMKDVHKTLLKRGVHGGKLLKEEFPELGEIALYCTTEIHTQTDLDRLISALQEAGRG